MSAAAPPSTPTGLVPRFALFIGVMKRCMADGIDWRRRQGTLGSLGLIAGPLWNYLSHTLRRFAALHARFAAGRLPPAGARRAPRPAPRATAPLDHPAPDTNNHAPDTAAPETAVPAPPPPIPRGPVFLEYGMGGSASHLREMLDEPEMRAFLAASPQARRILRPLWRRLSADPLPEALRPPPRPRRPRQAKPSPAERPRRARAEATWTAPAGRAAWRHPVSLWPDPAPGAAPEPPLPARRKPPWPD